MTLAKRQYKAFDVCWLTFLVSPLYTALYLILSIFQALIPTVATTLTTAYFVNTAIAILQNQRPHNDIYLPLILLLFVLGIFTTIDSIIKLISARIRLYFDRNLKAAMVKKNIVLDFKYIENADTWEIISHVSRDPTTAMMEGFGAYIRFMRLVISVASVLLLIIMQVWWAALIIIGFSTPLFWLSMWAGKKTYQAGAMPKGSTADQSIWVRF